MAKIKIDEIKKEYDCIVVGAGAAGTSFLKEINPDQDILLIDYKKLPRLKACSGILVNNSKKFFRTEKIPDAIFLKPKKININYQNWTNNYSNFSQKFFYNTNRQKLDEWLLSTIPKSVDILENTKATDVKQESGEISVMIEHNNKKITIKTRHLIGCDGAMSIVRKKIHPKQARYYLGIQEYISVTEYLGIQDAQFIFDEDITDFYSWIIPKDNGVEIGSALKPQNVKMKYKLFKQKVSEKFGITGDGDMQSAIILRPENIEDLCLGQGQIFLCGEAAGLISPSSAEGISFALISGKLCAEAINETNQDKLLNYTNKCKPLINRLENKFSKSENLSHLKY